MKLLKKYKLILFFLILFVLPIIVIYAQYNTKSRSEPSQEIVKPSENLTDNIELASEEIVWSTGNDYVIEVAFAKDPLYAPSVFDLYLEYDNTRFSLVETVAGGIWTNTNILTQTDNEDVINLVAGQAFESQGTESGTLAVFTFEVNPNASGEAEFKLRSDSSYASTQVESVILLNSDPLKIMVE